MAVWKPHRGEWLMLMSEQNLQDLLLDPIALTSAERLLDVCGRWGGPAFTRSLHCSGANRHFTRSRRASHPNGGWMLL